MPRQVDTCTLATGLVNSLEAYGDGPGEGIICLIRASDTFGKWLCYRGGLF